MNKELASKVYMQVIIVKTERGDYALGIQEISERDYLCDVINLDKKGNHSIICTETELYDPESAAAEGMRHIMGFLVYGSFDDETSTQTTIQ